MRAVEAAIGAAVLFYAISLAFYTGVWAHQNGDMNTAGVSGFFWVPFFIFATNLGANFFSGLFGLSEERAYSHSVVSVTNGTGSSYPVFLSPRDRRAGTIAGLVGLAGAGLCLYTAVYFDEKAILQDVASGPLFTIGSGLVDLSAVVFLAAWSVIVSVWRSVF